MSGQEMLDALRQDAMDMHCIHPMDASDAAFTVQYIKRKAWAVVDDIRSACEPEAVG